VQYDYRIPVDCVLAAAAVLAVPAAPAGAHATLLETRPGGDSVVDAVPEAVELVFAEPVETVEDSVRVFGPDGDRVDTGTVETADGGAVLRAPIEPAGTQGTYTVAWRVTSTDGHTISGSFVFHHGTATGAVDVDDVGSDRATDVVGGIGRWLAYAGMLTAAGAATLALLRPGPGGAGPDGVEAGGAPEPGPAAGPPDPGTGDGDGPTGGATGTPSGDAPGAAGAPGRTATLAPPAGPPAPAAAPAGLDAAGHLLRRLALVGALAGAAGGLVALAAAVGESTGRNPYDALADLLDVAPDSRTGRLALLRVALCLAAGAAAAVVELWRRSPVPVLAATGAALATASLGGHAWTAPDRWPAVASDLAHLGAVAVWAGGLVALLVTLTRVGPGERAALARRFSGLALVAVAVVAASGAVSGWQQVGRLDALWSTTYGRLLVAKVAGVGVLVALGWLNRARLVPLVERTAAPLARSLRVEVGVAAVVLALTAALVQLPPGRNDDAPAGPYGTQVTAETGEVLDLTVAPARAGVNDLHMYFYAPSGTEPLAVDAVQVAVSTDDVPPRTLPATAVTPNHVIATGVSLPTSGTWTVEVTAVRSGEPVTFTTEVPIP
ncbi:MAG: copper resistance protein CopC, partial [Acidimicrobiia bacterium]